MPWRNAEGKQSGVLTMSSHTERVQLSAIGIEQSRIGFYTAVGVYRNCDLQNKHSAAGEAHARG